MLFRLQVVLLAVVVVPDGGAAQPKGAANLVVHVAAEGNDANPGTRERPVLSLSKAVSIIDRQAGRGEVIVHGGRYRLKRKTVIGRPDNILNAGPILIRAADGEHPVFDGGIDMAGRAEPLSGFPGVFAVKGPYRVVLPDIWESTVRNRYKLVADAETVSRFEHTFAKLDDQTVVFHPSGGRAPVPGQVSLSNPDIAYAGISVERDKVTLKGLEFENFVNGPTASGVEVLGRDVVIESCVARNCYNGFYVGDKSENARIINCQVFDTATGIRIRGKEGYVEGCTILKHQDDFLHKRLSDQDDSGILVYYPAVGSTLRKNLVKGFACGIYLKCNEGLRHVIEHNTLVRDQLSASTSYGVRKIGSAKTPFVLTRNILVGYVEPLYHWQYLSAQEVVENNIFWSPRFASMQQKTIEKIEAGPATASGNAVVDPMFVFPPEDFRVLASSPAVNLGVPGNPAGALAAAGKGIRAVPYFDLAAQCDSRNTKAVDMSKLVFPEPEAPAPKYITKIRDVKLLIQNPVSSSPLTELRLRINREEEKTLLFSSSIQVKLPDEDAVHSVSVRIGNDKGHLSQEREVHFLLARKPVQVMGPPIVRANAYGAIVQFTTDRPIIRYRSETFGTIIFEYSVDGQKWERGTCSPTLSDTKYVAGTTSVKPGATYQYRLTLQDELFTQSNYTGTFTTAPAPAAFLHVAPGGADSPGRGTEVNPFQSIQYALNHALPGDTIKLAGGIYYGSITLTHGGVEGHPITIEGPGWNQAILDAGHEAANLVLEDAPYVTVKNLVFRWFKDHAVLLKPFFPPQDGRTESGSHHFAMIGCYTYNRPWSNEFPAGVGLACYQSPSARIERSVFTNLWEGVILGNCPHSTVCNNTMVATGHTGLRLGGALEGIAVTKNAFCHTGGVAPLLFERFDFTQPDRLRNLNFDYNNYGTPIRPEAPKHPHPNVRLPANLSGYFINSKQIVYLDPPHSASPAHAFYTLADWQAYSGLDRHSIYADPKFVDPPSGRFDVAEDSPNLRPGIGFVGAFGFQARGVDGSGPMQVNWASEGNRETCQAGGVSVEEE